MLGGRMVWVGMSRGRFVGGRNVKALYTYVCLYIFMYMYTCLHSTDIKRYIYSYVHIFTDIDFSFPHLDLLDLEIFYFDRIKYWNEYQHG
jgi:hypothetical protein